MATKSRFSSGTPATRRGSARSNTVALLYMTHPGSPTTGTGRASLLPAAACGAAADFPAAPSGSK